MYWNQEHRNTGTPWLSGIPRITRTAKKARNTRNLTVLFCFPNTDHVKKFNVDVNVICFQGKRKSWELVIKCTCPELITRSLQLHHILFTAFSQTNLFLVWIYLEFRSLQEREKPIAIISTDCRCIGLLWEFEAPSNGLLSCMRSNLNLEVMVCVGASFLCLYFFLSLPLYLLISLFTYYFFISSLFLCVILFTFFLYF